MSSRAPQLLFKIFVILAVAITQPITSSTAFARGQQRPQTPSSADTVSVQPSTGGGAVIVSVAKSRVRVGELVTFTLTPARIVTDPRYKVTVDFGDGTRLATRQVNVTHRYGATGHYKVHASVVSPTIDDPNRPDPQQPIPRVTLDASPLTTDANKPVTFSAQLSSSYPGIRYRFVFGDGSQTDWIASSRTNHSYAAPGTYQTYVDLGLNDGGRIKQVGGSVRQSVVVNESSRRSDPDLRDPKNPDDPKKPDDKLPGPVRLVAGPTPVQQGKSVNFDASAEATNSNVRYRFVFGDGSSQNWQTSDKVKHEYKSKGNYSATVTLGLFANGRVRALSSDTQRILVTSSAPATAVDFQVNPASVSLGQSVGFNARVTPGDSDLRYRFVFGDGTSQTEWQTAPQASYAYKQPGSYTAHVEIGRWTNGRVSPLATSDNRAISVTDGAVSSTSPSPGPSGGGGSGGSSSGDSGSTSSSPSPVTNDSSDTRTVLPDNWWLYLLLALLLVFIAYQIFKSLLAPRTSFHASRDVGSAEVDTAAKGLEISSQVLLRPNVTDAQYLVYSDGAIVRSVRRENA